MKPIGLQRKQDGAYELNGLLTFTTVPDLLDQYEMWHNSGGNTITIDLQQVDRADSAGLAMMIEWVRLARSKGQELRFTHIPQQLAALIRISGLQGLFPADVE